jgi:hypothetical protein
MNSSKVILALWLSASALGASAWGQVMLQKQPPNPPVAARPKAAPAPPPASSPKHQTVAPGKTAKPVSSYSRIPRTRHRSSGPATVGANRKPRGKVQRDPFVSPVVERSRSSIPCAGSGKQCLEVGDVSLHGVVRAPSGFIAVVVNGDHTYFLRENDPLANGAVTRITRDSIVLRERYVDDAGKTVTREVTRKISGVHS